MMRGGEGRGSLHPLHSLHSPPRGENEFTPALPIPNNNIYIIKKTPPPPHYMRRTLQRLAMSSTSVKFIPQGAIIQEFLVGPDSRNIVLSFNTAAEYRSNPAHFGATIGRVANRLKNAKLDCLNGTVYPLAVNDPPNSLHGGIKGWGAVDWTGPTVENRVSGRETVVYKYRSVHMEEGFPGTVDVSVAYTAYEEATDEAGVTKTVLEMEYEANLVGEDVEETAINITNHRYNSRPPPLPLFPP